jgi:hypothetical protein
MYRCTYDKGANLGGGGTVGLRYQEMDKGVTPSSNI